MHWFLFAGFYCISLLSFVQSNSRVLKMQNYKIERTSQVKVFAVAYWIPGGGGGVTHKYFFDRDARPRTNFNYFKK